MACLKLEYQKVLCGTLPKTEKPAQPVMRRTKLNDFPKGDRK